MASESFDVAIAGGGPAGAAAAIVLARAGVRVLVADARAETDALFRVGEGLPPSARHLLRELGVLDRVLADGHRPSPGTLAHWQADSPHANDFLYQLHGHGLQLDRARFDASLRAAAREAGVEVVESAHLHVAATEPGVHSLQLRGDGGSRMLEARWLIDATGRAATLARALGAKQIRHDRLFAFHLRLVSDAATDEDGRTRVEAVEDGWWYSVLLPSRQRLVVFLGDPDPSARRVLLDGDGLWRKLSDAPNLTASCMEHGYRPLGRALGADASSTMLDQAAGSDWLAVGDAATAFDPLSSKGISNALYTGMQAARAIMVATRGDASALMRYAAHVTDIYRVYREQLRVFYTMQRRWSDSEFWSSRRR